MFDDCLERGGSEMGFICLFQGGLKAEDGGRKQDLSHLVNLLSNSRFGRLLLSSRFTSINSSLEW